jgi:hypothetical protein
MEGNSHSTCIDYLESKTLAPLLALILFLAGLGRNRVYGAFWSGVHKPV